ncbi:hypothetical protein C8R45DRAFT_585902 [Mycena sanguinolenta]|nr:hypothetical protein C8R45DRAFT_585902 [Mycena sanguinolenta]
MNRFRKKSDAKHPTTLQPAPPPVQQSQTERHERFEPGSPPDALPELPLASDFRTSLILTDLSRRFTLLGATSNDSLSVDVLKSRLADQRTRGAENQISEEEEEMIIETLGLRQAGRPDEADEYSSNSVSARSAASSGTSTSSKRYSNNLFGSGRFRDYSYMRSVSQAKTSSMRTSNSSRTHTASYADSMRPVTPDANVTPSSSASSSPETLAVRSAPLIPPAPYGGQPFSVAEYRLSKTLGPSVLRRASLALEEAIKAIEEEAEDEIVMPRSPPVPRGSLDTQRQSTVTTESELNQTHGVYESPMAISSDRHMSLDAESPRASPIPARTVPGYVPGMPRPMTPRDTMELDDQRSYSTTPRATSPTVASPSPIPPPNLSSGLIRRESTSSPSRHSPRPSSPNVSSPMFLQRTPNGRYTPEAESTFSGDFEGSLNSSILGRRRPASPLSGTAYQPIAVSGRPGTPSNLTWTNGNSKGHTRDASWISDSSGQSEQSAARSLRSPALPDSPLIGPGHSTMNSFSSTFSTTSSFESPRPMSSISGVDIGSPVIGSSRILRSPTPTQVTGRSPTTGSPSNFEISSKNGSRRSSKQNTASTPFTLGPFQPLVFSPIANSSRSSLESAGSSYHSWDGDHKDRTAALFSDVDPQRPLWHEISSNNPLNYETPNSSPDDWEAEDLIMKYAGLKKDDFVAIQDKLIGAAIAKTMTPDIHHRTPSLRRRRPSTSQSNYSLNGRLGSPPQSPTTAAPTTDQYSALLNSMGDTIQSSSTSHSQIEVDTTNNVQPDDEVSPTSRRNRDLAQVLFGQQDKEDKKIPPSNLTVSVSGNVGTTRVPNSAPLDSSFPMHSPQPVPPSSASASWPYQPSRNPSTPRLPQSAQEHAELAREVQRKADEAMVMLQKQPSTPNLALPSKAPTTRRRINPNQISTPFFLSASTSVDTIPLPSPPPSITMTSGQSKIGSRLKRLRGSLRTKTAPTAEDVTPFPMDLRSPPPVQTARYDSTKFQAQGGPTSASATDSEGFKVPVPSPPASAGPGLKGFMARFRGKQRASETQTEFDYQRPQALAQHLSPHSSETVFSQATSSQSLNSHSPSDSVPILPPIKPRTPPPPSTSMSAPVPPQHNSTTRTTAPLYSSRPHQSVQSTHDTEADPSDAIKQLFDAASNLGLDQGALNDLLARSGSTSSRSDWTLKRNNSGVISRPDLPQENTQTGAPNRSNSQRTRLTVPTSEGVTQTSQSDHIRRPRENAPDKSAVVRRTIIYPSDSRSSTIDLSVLMRKHSSKSRRRASATSVSSRSVHDRVPTPPPPKANTGRRFSDVTSPPVPSLTQSLQTERLLISPQVASPGEQASSAYDSLYDMYPGEKSASSSAVEIAQNGPIPEGGPAVEVIELANGETIWSIINGLRDEDDDLDGYANRASFTSEYSAGEGVQVFFKEHGRKGSGSSFLPRRKTLIAKSRPETKVFYSSSAQIGRLIENMSQGMEAGSFNILPTHPLGHSTSSSLSENEMNWTVEERLEHMLHGLR